ncbi:thiamine phosphate synthase [Pseudozobellia thermophila]|uniref:Thiamine-phosphate synthase n=1 Tax=Pseudozobellia thermophila TaxID=192903 RepID=A0A1M6FT31_9FLAO|nr:thiamine phosphate synthase [Pseudozobellia thermophila]SHJ00810.1 thiamine-phosphate diphosphorylase [Pseudozobellia thermophila]
MGIEFPYRLYLVVSQESCAGRSIIEVAEQAIAGGVDIVQLREKNIPTEVFVERAMLLKDVLDKHNVPLIINDNLEVAMKVGALGIHVGNNDTPPTGIRATWGAPHCLGYSIEYLEQLQTDQTKASDYLGVSPVFSTATKTDTVTEWGLGGLARIRALTDKPLVAIGSINVDNAFEVVRAGADCLAVVSAICQAQDPAKAAEGLRNEIEKAL